MSNDIGGLWRYKENDCNGEGTCDFFSPIVITPIVATVMKSTVINTSKEMTAYSDYVPPADFANFMHNTKMLEVEHDNLSTRSCPPLQYFRMYAAHYNLHRYINFRVKVHNVQRAPDYAKSAQWHVDIEHL